MREKLLLLFSWWKRRQAWLEPRLERASQPSSLTRRSCCTGGRCCCCCRGLWTASVGSVQNAGEDASTLVYCGAGSSSSKSDADRACSSSSAAAADYNYYSSVGHGRYIVYSIIVAASSVPVLNYSNFAINANAILHTRIQKVRQ